MHGVSSILGIPVWWGSNFIWSISTSASGYSCSDYLLSCIKLPQNLVAWNLHLLCSQMLLVRNLDGEGLFLFHNVGDSTRRLRGWEWLAWAGGQLRLSEVPLILMSDSWCWLLAGTFAAAVAGTSTCGVSLWLGLPHSMEAGFQCWTSSKW